MDILFQFEPRSLLLGHSVDVIDSGGPFRRFHNRQLAEIGKKILQTVQKQRTLQTEQYRSNPSKRRKRKFVEERGIDLSKSMNIVANDTVFAIVFGVLFFIPQ